MEKDSNKFCQPVTLEVVSNEELSQRSNQTWDRPGIDSCLSDVLRVSQITGENGKNNVTGMELKSPGFCFQKVKEEVNNSKYEAIEKNHSQRHNQGNKKIKYTYKNNPVGSQSQMQSDLVSIGILLR